MVIEVKKAASAVGGELMQGRADALATGVSTDSRTVKCGDLFVALKGPNFDGHRFIKDVASKGALVAIVETAEGLVGLPHDFSLIVVKDTTVALGALAAYHRSRFAIPVIAISGSAGKTTTKEMIASILSRSRKVLKTEGNKNNLIGLPQTLFGLDESHEAAVVELGISETWEMERLVGICSPTIAVLTNIGRSHLESLGTVDGVAKAKGPLFTKMGSEGYKAVNLDDERIVKIAEGTKNRVTYSLEKKADVTLKSSQAEGFERLRAVYDVRGKKAEVVFTTPGASNLINGAAAIATVLPLGVSIKDMEEGLSTFSQVKGRMVVVKTGGLTILDDTYNANPESMASSLKTLKGAPGRTVAIMGEMLELGEASKAEHAKIGKTAVELGIDVVIGVGARADDIAGGAVGAGKKDSVYSFETKKEAIASLRDILKENDSILVKGSRGVSLEEVVEGIRNQFLSK